MTENYAQQAKRAYLESRYQEALELYGKAVADHPESPELHMNLAAVYCTIDDHINCIVECRKVLELSSQEPRVSDLRRAPDDHAPD